MHWHQSLLLGIIEGLTEFLPVSSTGHLILATEWLHIPKSAYADANAIVIQLGAILAVVLYYRHKLVEIARGLVRRDPVATRLFVAINIAFLPAAVIGLALNSEIKKLLFFKGPIAIALVVGGVFMIGVEIFRRRTHAVGEDGLDKVTPKRALAIGIAQCFSLIPGTSRSMMTIVGGQLSGLSTATAAEFSFLLMIETLGAATCFELVKSREVLLGAADAGLNLAIGLVVSFVVALVVVAAFLRFLKRFGLGGFGVYRVVFGAFILFSAWNQATAWPPSHDATTTAATSSASAPDASPAK